MMQGGMASSASRDGGYAAGEGKGKLRGSTVSAADSWTIDQLVAAVPVRPYIFSEPPRSVSTGGRYGAVEYRGSVPKLYMQGEARFSVFKGIFTDNEVAQLLSGCSQVLSEEIRNGRGRDPDPVDGHPSFAVKLADMGLFSETMSSTSSSALRPLVETVLLPLVRQHYDSPTAALSSAFFRRFVPEERRFIAPHHEHGAFAVVVVSLQEPATSTGGLFVQGSEKAFLDRRFVQLERGDLCMFQYDLHHGTDVQDGFRYELVLHFKDSAEAALDGTCPWYRTHVDKDNESALYGLALSLASAKDFRRAKAFLDKACDGDHPEAMFTAAEWFWEPPARSGLQESTHAALSLWQRAAELGHSRSQSRYGGLLVQGVHGRIQQDVVEGKRLLRLAFEQDDPDAGFFLGQRLLQEGDRDGATKLLAACLKGHPRACFQVAEMYREGQHKFPKDLQQSLRYTKWAAHQGDAQALSNLGHLLVNGMGVVKDEAKAVRLFRHAAQRGAAEGMLNYGLALLRGSGGVKVDYQEALKWAQKSAAMGHSLAHQQLSMFFNAAKNPNPPARCVPSSMEELRTLGVRDLRDLLRSEGMVMMKKSHLYEAPSTGVEQKFQDVCLIDTLRAHGYKVDYASDGPFWAIQDGSTFLEPFRKTVARTTWGQIATVANGQFILTIGAHFIALRHAGVLPAAAVDVNWLGTSKSLLAVAIGCSRIVAVDWPVQATERSVCGSVIRKWSTRQPTLSPVYFRLCSTDYSQRVVISIGGCHPAGDRCWCEITAPFADTVVIELGHGRLGRPSDKFVTTIPRCMPDRILQDCDVQQWERLCPSSDKCEGIAAVMEGHDVVNLVGIDFSDCVEKSDLVSRAALHLPGVAEPWDSAPEHMLLLEPKRPTKEEILRQRAQAANTPPGATKQVGATEEKPDSPGRSRGSGRTETVFELVDSLVKNSLEQRIASSDAARELELRLLSEQELRLKEGASWNQRLATLQRERDHLQAQLTNDTAQLASQLEDSSRRKAEEISQLEAQICQLQTNLVSSESRLSEERSQNGDTIANLKGQLAELSDSTAMDHEESDSEHWDGSEQHWWHHLLYIDWRGSFADVPTTLEALSSLHSAEQGAEQGGLSGLLRDSRRRRSLAPGQSITHADLLHLYHLHGQSRQADKAACVLKLALALMMFGQTASDCEDIVHGATDLLDEIFFQREPYGLLVRFLAFYALCVMASLAAFMGTYRDALAVAVMAPFVILVQILSRGTHAALEAFLVALTIGLLTPPLLRYMEIPTCDVPVLYLSPLLVYLPGSQLTYGAYEVQFGTIINGASQLAACIVRCMFLAIALLVGWQFFGHEANQAKAGQAPISVAAASLVPADMSCQFPYSWEIVFLGWNIPLLFFAFIGLNIPISQMLLPGLAAYVSLLLYMALQELPQLKGLPARIIDCLVLFVAANLALLREYLTGAPAVLTIIPVTLILAPGSHVVLSILASVQTSEKVPEVVVEPILGLVLQGTAYATGLTSAIHLWSAATLSAVRLQMQEVGHARDLLAAEVAETRLSLQSEHQRAEAQRSEAAALLQQVETRNTALQDQVNDLQTAVNQLSKEASREREVLEADRQRLQEMLVKEAQQAKESQEQYDRWRESHVESLRRVQDETSAKMLALEREKDGIQSELKEALRSLNTKQVQLEATDKDLQRLRSEAQEAAAVLEAKQQLSKELNEVTEALEGALRTEAALTAKIEDAAQRHQQEKRDLELQVLDKDSRLEKFKLDFETQLRISQSRLAGELNKEKAKADLAAALLP
ncbi:Localization factor PodJL [Symbiodinium microadriaticum]|uniref:Localization factor PodJL n=1 Tax=Symbiodinium microadriaticum TaxID=2951 RepID=A0A1Q9CMZ5_SYMMI|nr:Localization factor PodJL [Symbiodinium microadriaticum]